MKQQRFVQTLPLVIWIQFIVLPPNNGLITGIWEKKKKREKKKRKKETYKNGAKALEKAFVTCLFSSLRALKFALPLHPYDETSHSYIFPLFSGELNQKASVHPTTMNS